MDTRAALDAIDRLLSNATAVAVPRQCAKPVGLAAALAFAAAVHAGTPPLHVDQAAPPGGNGLTWNTAFRDLQDALAASRLSRPGGGPPVIKVAQGIYLPDRGTRSRFSSFSIASGTQILGGFAGIAGSNPDRRDPSAFVSILSGDLAGDDGTDWQQHNAENAYHVVEASRGDGNCSLQGLTIQGGNSTDPFGAIAGAGIYAGRGVALFQCIVRRNFAFVGAGAFGDRVHATGCLFTENYAYQRGAAVAADDGSAFGCRFIGNFGGPGVAWSAGRTFHATDSQFVGASNQLIVSSQAELFILDNCTLMNGDTAPAIDLRDASDARITNCILWHQSPNSAQKVIRAVDSRLMIGTSCIFRAREGIDAPEGSGSLQWAPGNFSADPRLVVTLQPAYEIRLGAGSPCIDRSVRSIVPSIDALGQSRVHDDPGTPNTGAGEYPTVDIGAVEFQETSCRADADGSGAANQDDLFWFLQFWFLRRDEADLNRNGEVSLQDLFDFVAVYLAGC